MNGYGLVDDAVAESWSEAALNDQNAPGIQLPADGGVAHDSGEASIDAAQLTLLGTLTTLGNANLFHLVDGVAQS